MTVETLADMQCMFIISFTTSRSPELNACGDKDDSETSVDAFYWESVELNLLSPSLLKS